MRSTVLLSAALAAVPAFAQSPVTGTVVDADGGEGLPGVNCSRRGSTQTFSGPAP